MKKSILIVAILFVCMGLEARENVNQVFHGMVENQVESARIGRASFVPFRYLDEMDSDADRSKYMIERFWNDFPFHDTNVLHDDRFRGTIQHYLRVIQFADLETIQQSLVETIRSADTNERMWRFFIEAFDFHLNDALSGMRNLQWIEPVWHEMLRSRWITFSDSARVNFFLRMANKNPIGSVATDLEFVTFQGQRGRMSEIEAELLLVFFYIPGCPQCAMTIEWLEMDTAYHELINSGIMRGFAFYPGEDMNAFRSYRAIPNTWINARDPDGMSQLETDGLYQMRGAPTIYLLDRDKRVILKDARLDLLFNEFDRARDRFLR